MGVRLSIRNFKSIASLELELERVNVLIGDLGGGKSNILESLGLLSFVAHRGELSRYVRFSKLLDFFHFFTASEDFEVCLGGKLALLGEMTSPRELVFVVEGRGAFLSVKAESEVLGSSRYKVVLSELDPELSLEAEDLYSEVKFYRFFADGDFGLKRGGYLLPPSGENLLYLMVVNRELREVVASLFRGVGYALYVKPMEETVEVAKPIGETLVNIPFNLLSDTLQRFVFFLAAVKTNSGSLLVMEEPESHSFPRHVRFLAEVIARDESNRYVISTHSPYFLLSLVEKTPKEDLSVYLVYMEEGVTKARRLSEEKLREIMKLRHNAFFNLETLLEGEEHV